MCLKVTDSAILGSVSQNFGGCEARETYHRELFCTLRLVDSGQRLLAHPLGLHTCRVGSGSEHMVGAQEEFAC